LEKLIEVVDETAEQFGFRQIDPQVLKDNNSGLKKEEGQEIVEQMYAFNDKKATTM